MSGFETPPINRHAALIPLSRDHYIGLVHAQRLIKAASKDRVARHKALADFLDAWRTEIEPHFRDEELRILPALERAGEHALVARTLADHRRLRELATGPATTENARELGALLTAHVRFEERTLFPAFEQLVLV